jgi:hypothetical protein
MERNGEVFELKVLRAKGVLAWVLGFFGGGAGVTIAYAAIRAVQGHPDFLPQLLSGGGLWFASLMIGMVVAQRQFSAFNAMQERGIVAQERLAANVGALVNKDEQRAREQELTLNHLARQSDEILKHLAELRKDPGCEMRIPHGGE